jgi:hypothetical protein
MAAGNDDGAVTCAGSLCVSETLKQRAKEGVLMHFSWKRWRLALIAVLTALGLSVAFAGQALAAEPGEWGSWGPETVNNHNMQVASQGTVAEARNGGNLLDVWRGADNNQVWLSWNNGPAYTIAGNTATYVSPAVVAWGSSGFMIFHTGVDGHIYYTPINGEGATTGQWFSVPDQTTNMPVSVTQLGPGSYDLYMVYRGVGNDQRIWGTRFNSADNGWDSTENIGEGDSPSAPSVVWNNEPGTLNVVARGEDGEVWLTEGFTNDWSPWYAEGGNAIDTPHIAVTSGGTMLVDYVGTDYSVYYRVYDMEGNSYVDWQPDSTGYQSHYPVQLSAYGFAIYAILTGLDGLVWYKQAYNNNN